MMQIPKNLEAFVRSRAARLGLAMLFIAVSVWAFVPYITHRAVSLYQCRTDAGDRAYCRETDAGTPPEGTVYY